MNNRSCFGLGLLAIFSLILNGCSERADRFYSQALSQAQDGKYSQAESTLHRLISLEPEVARGHLALAALYQAQNEFEPAIDELEKTISLVEQDPTPPYALGCLYQRLDKPNLAQERFQEALKRDPEHVGSLYRLGVLYQQQGDFSNALKYYNEALVLNPEGLEAARNNAGVIFWGEGDQDRALQEFSLALKASSANPVFLYNFGVAQLRVGTDQAQGLRAIRDYLEIEPPPPDRALVMKLLREKGIDEGQELEYLSPQETLEKGMILEGRGDLEGALESYQRVLEAESDNIQAHYRLAILFDDKLGDRRRAIESYEAFLDQHRNPKSELVSEVVKRLGKARRELGEVAVAGGQGAISAPARITTPISVAPVPTPARDLGYFLGAGQRAEKNGRWADALDFYSQGVESEPESFEAHFGQGRVHQAMGRYEEALKALESASQLKKSAEVKVRLEQVYLKLAEIAESDSDPARAASFYRRAGRDDQAALREWEGLELAVKQTRQQGKDQETIELLKKMTSLKPDDPEPWLAWGDILYEQDDLSPQCRKAYRGFLKAGPRHPQSQRVRALLSRKPPRPIPSPTFAPVKDPRTLYNQGVALQRSKRNAEASQKYREALKLKPQFYQAAYNLGIIYNQQGDYRQALSYYKKVVKINPEFAPAHLSLFKLYYNKFKMAGPARDHARKYLKLQPSGPQAEKLRKWLKE